MGLIGAFSRLPSEPTKRELVERHAAHFLTLRRDEEWQAAATLCSLTLSLLGNSHELYEVGGVLAAAVLTENPSGSLADDLRRAYPEVAKQYRTKRDLPERPSSPT